jgi:glycerol-3-phosphate dehydrogenase
MMPERWRLRTSSAPAPGAGLNYVGREDSETNTGITVTARDVLADRAHVFRSKVLINASGPWIDSVRRAGNIDSRKIIFPTKGIHLVLPKLSEQALFVTSKDGRMFFIIPLDRWSLIGTTDTKYEEAWTKCTRTRTRWTT